MHFLNPRRRFRRHTQFNVVSAEQRSNLAAIAAGQCDNDHVAIVGSLDALNDIGGIPASGNPQKDIARIPECSYLFGIDFVVAVIVGDGGERR
jgi:hypothetical protein